MPLVFLGVKANGIPYSVASAIAVALGKGGKIGATAFNSHRSLKFLNPSEL